MTRYGVSHDRQYAAVPYTPAARSRYSSGLQHKIEAQDGIECTNKNKRIGVLHDILDCLRGSGFGLTSARR